MFKKLFSFAVGALLCATPLTAKAAITGAQLSSYKLYAGGASTALVVAPYAGATLSGIVNANTAAQTATITCYDNASAASGTVLYSVVLGASQYQSLGIPATAGITCIASAATNTGAGILFIYR